MRPTAPRPRLAWSVRMAMAVRRSRRQRLGNGSMAVLAGLRSSAIAARPARACRSMPSGDRAGTGSGSWRLECRSCKKGRYARPVHMIKLTAGDYALPVGASGRGEMSSTGDRDNF